MIIRNRIRVGWLTAQPERLKRFMSLSNDIELVTVIASEANIDEAMDASSLLSQ